MLLLYDLVLLCLYVTSSASANRLDRSTWAESLPPLPAPAWGYTNNKSPVVWGTPDAGGNKLCAKSKFQSPINLNDSIGTASDLVITWPASFTGELLYEHYAIQVENFHSVSPITKYGGQDYRLDQFHFHTPSEHRFNEEYFVLEMHLVHVNTKNASSRLVLAVVFEVSLTGPIQIIQTIANFLPFNPDLIYTIDNINLQQIVDVFTRSTIPKYAYSGSLTVPPCTEGVTFVIPKNYSLPISISQFISFKKFMKFNSRYTQNFPGQPNLLELAKVVPQVYAEKESELIFGIEED